MATPKPARRIHPSQGENSNGATARPPTSSSSSTSPNRNIPYLTTPTETLAFALYPALLLFGSAFSIISPETRAAPYDPVAQAHDAALAPSYFARKSNIVNKLFVKQGWAWMMVAFLLFIITNRTFGWLGSDTAAAARRRRSIKACIRFTLVTAAWIFVTQWFFGPALIDRGFRLTGGKCDSAIARAGGNVEDLEDVWASVACKAAGGKWNGGHDISGHVFLLVLGSGALLQEAGWVLWRASTTWPEERRVVMPDGAVKTASVEALEQWQGASNEGAGIGVKVVAGVIGLSWWMILMTAIYFHTWSEKITGLLVALSCLYLIYILPRWVPAVRAITGIPGI